MNNRNSEKSMFRQYFADFYKWNISVTILFAIIYILELTGVWGSSWGRCWLIPACYLLVLLIILRYYILFFVAVKDMKKNRIEETTILVHEIVRDKKYNFYNKGGAMVGKEKCLLIDSSGNKYRVVIMNQDLVIIGKDYLDAQVIIRYLSMSRIVLHMKLKLSKESSGATQRLRKAFDEYF